MNRKDYIDTAYEILVEAFGEPSGPSDDGKVLAEWQLTTPHGWVEVYDYKSYATSPYDVEEWHVQAERDGGFEYVYEEIRKASARHVSSVEGSQDG